MASNSCSDSVTTSLLDIRLAPHIRRTVRQANAWPINSVREPDLGSYLVKRIAAGNVDALPIHPTDRHIGRADLALGFAAVDRQIDGSEQLARRIGHADDAGAAPTGRIKIPGKIGLHPVTSTDAAGELRTRPDRAVRLHRVTFDETVPRREVEILFIW